MSQDATGGVQANNPGASFRAALNTSLAAIITLNSGATAPTATYAYMLWADTTTGLLKQRDSANATWVAIGTMGQAYLGFDSRYQLLSALNALTAVGSQAQISADTSPLWEGTQSTLASGAAYALNGNLLIMKFWAHNVSINTSGNFTGVSETGIATVMFWGEDDVLRVFTAPSVTAGTTPTFGTTPTYSLDMKNGILRSAPADDFANFTSTVAANALTGTLTAPVMLNFRNATLGTGTPVGAPITSSLTLTVPSGATLGTTNGVATRLVWLVAYNGGTPVLCVVNMAGGVQLDETNLISPTTISAGATSAGVIYSASAVGANSPYRVIGFTDVTEATAGTWATAPSTVQPVGGQALTSLGSMGYSQTWQTVTRNSGTTYYNTTGRPITLKIAYGSATNVANVAVTINGYTFNTDSTQAGFTTSVTYVVPAEASYSYTLTGTGATSTSSELR